jgi:hypothetical protein
LQDAGIDREILICSSDAHNASRPWCRRRKESLAALCARLDVPCACLDFDSDFYRTPHRPPRGRGGLRRLLPRKRPDILLGRVAETILGAVEASDCDAVFTHNFWGEYGHLDHVFLHTLMLTHCRKPVYVTDIRMAVDWAPMPARSPAYEALLRPHFLSTHTLDRAFYEECAAFYKSAGVWTWSLPPIPSAGLYRIAPPPDDAKGNASGGQRGAAPLESPPGEMISPGPPQFGDLPVYCPRSTNKMSVPAV